MKQLIILTDGEEKFLVSIADLQNFTSMDTSIIKKYFLTKGYGVKIIRFSDLDLASNYSNYIILYQTSEAPGSFYKRYIEDIIFHLEKQGAMVLPPTDYLRAHHNKLYMEMIRSRFSDNALKSITSRFFGEEKEALKLQKPFPVVIKQSSGAGSSGVYLARNKTEYKKYIHCASEVVFAQNLGQLTIGIVKNKAKKYLSMINKKHRNRIAQPIYRPIVVQNYIKGLTGDYKVLFFGNKYYTLYRENRDNDFRASGSGKLFEVPEQDHEGLLGFARKLTFEIDFPIIGMDIGFDGTAYHLIEFQMIHLGPYTLQAANFWHEYINNKWVRFEGKSNLEEEFSRSIYEYIQLKAKV